MAKKTFFTLCFFMLMLVSAQAQPESVEMADVLRESGKIYVVVAVLAIIFAGILSFLVYLERKISGLEKQIKNP